MREGGGGGGIFIRTYSRIESNFLKRGRPKNPASSWFVQGTLRALARVLAGCPELEIPLFSGEHRYSSALSRLDCGVPLPCYHGNSSVRRFVAIVNKPRTHSPTQLDPLRSTVCVDLTVLRVTHISTASFRETTEGFNQCCN